MLLTVISIDSIDPYLHTCDLRLQSVLVYLYPCVNPARITFSYFIQTRFSARRNLLPLLPPDCYDIFSARD
jgi:hypothetical protein